MDFVEAVIARIVTGAIDTGGYFLGAVVMAAAVFALSAVIHYVLKWTGAFKKPPVA